MKHYEYDETVLTYTQAVVTSGQAIVTYVRAVVTYDESDFDYAPIGQPCPVTGNVSGSLSRVAAPRGIKAQVRIGIRISQRATRNGRCCCWMTSLNG